VRLGEVRLTLSLKGKADKKTGDARAHFEDFRGLQIKLHPHVYT